jgi:hypothetical protein
MNDETKKCAVCGAICDSSAICCENCGRGAFETIKKNSSQADLRHETTRERVIAQTKESPEKVRICIIHDRSKGELWIVGDRFVPTEPIARRVAQREKFSGAIRTASANRSFEGSALDNESFMGMFALIQMKSELKNIAYEFIALGERGALYTCPQCRVLLKKDPAKLELSRAGLMIAGNTGCLTCGATFSIGDVFAGKYDL